MRKRSIIMLLSGLISLNVGIVGWAAPKPNQPALQSKHCMQLAALRESPILLLPQPFEKGCAISTPLRANNPGTLVYVLQAGMKLPFPASNREELLPAQIEALNRLVDTGKAMRITWFSPSTIGSQDFIQALPEETIFVAWNDLCTKFQPNRVVCVESGAFRVGQLTEILVKNKEQF